MSEYSDDERTNTEENGLVDALTSHKWQLLPISDKMVDHKRHNIEAGCCEDLCHKCEYHVADDGSAIVDPKRSYNGSSP